MARLHVTGAWLGVIALLVGTPAIANVDTALLADGWREVTFDDKIANRFLLDGSGGVRVESDGGVSLVERSLDVDLRATPFLSWRWRVDKTAPPTNLAIKGEDDRSLALYIAFPFVPEEASTFERMKRAVVERVVGKEAPGRVLMYVWGGEGERGERVTSPHLGSAGMMTILRPANSETERWQEESVDVADDYRRTFGSDPPNPMTIAVGADTDDTQSMALGVIADLDFIGRAPSEP